jgi:hypothetical protein
MVSRGLSAFISLLVVLADVGVDGGCMYGRCPDCWRPIHSENPAELIGDLLLHEIVYHPEHGIAAHESGAGGAVE